MKRAVRGEIRLDAFAIVSRAVEEGARYGIARAHKYTDDPSRETIEEHVYTAVMSALGEVLHFDGDMER